MLSSYAKGESATSLRVVFKPYQLDEGTVETDHGEARGYATSILEGLERADAKSWYSPYRWYEKACSMATTAKDLALSLGANNTTGLSCWGGHIRGKSVVSQFIECCTGGVPSEFQKPNTYIDFNTIDHLTRLRACGEAFDANERNKRDAAGIKVDRAKAASLMEAAKAREQQAQTTLDAALSMQWKVAQEKAQFEQTRTRAGTQGSYGTDGSVWI